jgi:hypothetical protein
MGDLYNMCQKLMKEVETRNPDPMSALRVKGQIARDAGFMVSLVQPSDMDDPQRINGVRNAAQQLGITL